MLALPESMARMNLRETLSQRVSDGILDALPFEGVVLDEAGRIERVNPAWIAFALEQGADLERCGVGTDYFEVVRSAEGVFASKRQEVFDGLRAVQQGTARSFSMRYSCPTGASDLWFDMTATSLGDGRLLILHQDVTEAETRVQELTEAARSAEARASRLSVQNQELATLSAAVFHDARAHLRAITVLGERIDEEKPPRPVGELVERIRLECRGLETLADRVMGLMEKRGDEIVETMVDLGSLARSVLTDLRQAEPQRRARIVTRGDLRVIGDPALMRSLVENLVGNAWKFTRDREEAVIEVAAIDEPGSPRVFYVRDNGIGFPAREAARLFKPFQRLHADRFEGTGIGLSFAKSIVAAHGGEMTAAGVEGRGATFYFTLPPLATPKAQPDASLSTS